jgi:hypothetical protein
VVANGVTNQWEGRTGGGFGQVVTGVVLDVREVQRRSRKLAG